MAGPHPRTVANALLRRRQQTSIVVTTSSSQTATSGCTARPATTPAHISFGAQTQTVVFQAAAKSGAMSHRARAKSPSQQVLHRKSTRFYRSSARWTGLIVSSKGSHAFNDNPDFRPDRPIRPFSILRATLLAGRHDYIQFSSDGARATS